MRLSPSPVGSALTPALSVRTELDFRRPAAIWRIGELVGVGKTPIYLVSEMLRVKTVPHPLLI